MPRSVSTRRHATAAAAILAVCALSGAASAETAFGVTDQQRLIRFDTTNPGSLTLGVSITGLAANDSIQGIDFRPSDQLLYGLGRQNNLYTINPATGAATLVSALSIPLNGGNFGFDFNPTGPVALRIVSNGASANNYRIGNPAAGGVVIQDTDLAYVAGDPSAAFSPNVTHVAYTNSVPGATTTALFGIDVARDTLVRITNPNGGTISTIGTLGMGSNANINVIGGFDISALSGIGFAATQNVSLSRSTLWQIDLVTGAGTDLGEIAGGETLVAFALGDRNIPAPSALPALALGALVLGRRRR